MMLGTFRCKGGKKGKTRTPCGFRSSLHIVKVVLYMEAKDHEEQWYHKKWFTIVTIRHISNTISKSDKAVVQGALN